MKFKIDQNLPIEAGSKPRPMKEIQAEVKDVRSDRKSGSHAYVTTHAAQCIAPYDYTLPYSIINATPTL